MQSVTQTIIRQNILLDDTETFKVKPPNGTLSWTINSIQVHDGCFTLHGWTMFHHQGANIAIGYAYRTTNEVPTMPTYVADEVRRALAYLKTAQLVIQ